MRSGRLNRMIDIERLGEMEIDDMGVPGDTWATVAKLPAEFVQVSADEFLTGGGTASASVVIFRTRYSDGVEATDRVRFNGRTFGILSVVELGRREGLEIRASTKAPDA